MQKVSPFQGIRKSQQKMFCWHFATSSSKQRFPHSSHDCFQPAVVVVLFLIWALSLKGLNVEPSTQLGWQDHILVISMKATGEHILQDILPATETLNSCSYSFQIQFSLWLESFPFEECSARGSTWLYGILQITHPAHTLFLQQNHSGFTG